MIDVNLSAELALLRGVLVALQAEQGCDRNVITYSSLIGACEKAGRWRLCLDIFGRMRKDGVAPNAAIYNAAMAAAAQGTQLLDTLSLSLAPKQHSS